MCGIAGFVGAAASRDDRKALLARMCGLLRHRGPDDEGFFLDDEAALGHRRLSIIDLAGGKQPMSDAGETIWVVFNGEIYNFPELKSELEAKGFAFRTRSDTEVIINGYAAWGDKVVERLNGMFAFALWDVRRRRLVLARDRLGKKPLYWRATPKGLAFASEMKSLLADPGLRRETDPAAVDKFFTYGYIPAPDTILKGVRKLRPGHLLVWDGKAEAVSQYWDVAYRPETGARSEDSWVEELESILTASVKRRLISDVSLGAFLSGGLDSSVVVALMSRISGSKVKTFTIGFEDAEFSELGDARRVAEAFGTEHREFTVTTDAMGVLPELVWHFDEPFGDSSAIPTYYVSQMARREVTVILSGDGGDELFAGYESHGRRGQYDHYRSVPRPLRKALAGPLGRMLPVHAPGRSLLLGIAELEKYMGGETVSLYPLIKDRVYAPGFSRALRSEEDPLASYAYWSNVPTGSRLSRLQYLDTKVYLPEDILMKVDRMSMANSLETRAPLLDYTLAEFAARIPPELQRKDGKGKYLLRKLAARLLPPESLAKKKQGFAIPREKWFRTDLRAWTADLLGSEKARGRGYFRPGVVDRILAEHARGSKDFSAWIWCLLNFELWHRTFIDADTRRI